MTYNKFKLSKETTTLILTLLLLVLRGKYVNCSLLAHFDTPSRTSRRRQPGQEVIPPQHGQPAGMFSLIEQIYLGFPDVFWHKNNFELF